MSTSGGLRTSVKGYLIAQRVTVAPEINTVHDSIYAVNNSTAAESVDHPPDPLSVSDTSASYGLNICDGNIPCLPMLSSAAKGMASYGARIKSESSPHIVPSSPRTEVEILQSFHLRSFHFNELKTATTNFCPDSIMAQGGLASVYKGWIDAHLFGAAKPGTGIAVLIKRFSQQRTLQRHKDWLTEVSFLGQLGHPNLVKLIGYCQEDGMRLLVHEFIPQESLNIHLYDRASRFKRLSWNSRMKIALGAAKGLAFLHSNEAKVIYGDFETSKILLDSDYNAKLYGYGSAIDRLQGYRSRFTEADVAMYEDGSFDVAAAHSVYAAPETSKVTGSYYFEDNSTPKSDVFSYGVVLLEMLSGRRAFDNSKPPREKSLVQFAKNISSQGGSSKHANKKIVALIFDAHIDGQYYQKRALKALNLAFQCISLEPQSRPDMNEVVEVLEQLQSSNDSFPSLCQF
ncbi:PREDICTED: protein kinase APK1B, chloroplastic-like [Fragaria vesca subsp. vesca]|uniref:protein kinase APK1B, chloroplastic-like n=1 Tax=Fragaria vesca subsp. vesca TaxID=101020 RepID=UPI0002C2F84E|nr:PREDICTED: protein kinase APK1B, chloroplastic-like [Fragaria vesca subsp. vesca]